MLGPLEAAEEDFKVFRIIENTLIGALIFMGSYLRTSWLLLTRPHRFYGQLSSATARKRLVRPFTYLALSAFGSYVVLRYQGLEFRFSRDVVELQNASATDVILNVLPMVAVAVLAGSLGAVLTQKESRRTILHLFCYLAGYQYLCLAAVSAAIVAYYSYTGIPSMFMAELGLIGWWAAGVLYIAVTTFVVLFPIHKTRLASWPKRIAHHAGTWLVAMTGLSGGVYAASFQGTQDFWSWITVERQEEYVNCTLAGAAMTDGDTLDATVVIRNPLPTAYLFTRAGVTITEVTIKGGTGGGQPSVVTSRNVSAEVTDWAGGTAPVLTVQPANTTWVSLRVPLTAMQATNARTYSDSSLLLYDIRFVDVEMGDMSCPIPPVPLRIRR